MSSRRTFLKQAAGATIAVAGAGTGAALIPGAAEARTFIPGTYSFEVDGIHLGFLYDAYGGDARYDVVVDGYDPATGRQLKRLSRQSLERATIQFGANMDPAFYDLVNASFAKTQPSFTCAIVVCDPATGAEIGRRWLTNAAMVSFNTR